MKYFNLLVLFAVLVACQPQTTYDIIIKNGLVYDGTNSEPIRADIAINADTIAKIGKLKNSRASQSIDATDLVVSPGFIDTHAHLDPLNNLLRLAHSESAIRQGVTTSIGGPDGGGVPANFSFASFLDTLETIGVGMNMGFMTGHNRVRRTVMNLDNRPPTAEELSEMVEMVDRAMDEGAFGLSTGLKYLPGNFAALDEVIELSKAAAQKGGIYTTHLRDEGLKIMDAVEETLEISKQADILVVLTHHKVIGKPMWGKSDTTLARVDKARSQGIQVMIDQYPYNASHTGLSILIPSWARAGGQEQFEARVSDAKLRKQIKEEIIFNILNDRGGEDLRRIQFSRVSWKPELEGQTLHDWLLMEGIEPTIENGAEMVIQGQLNGGAGCIFHAMDEADVENIMTHPLTMIASDGRLSEPGVGHPHPRAYGTFPRVLGRYVRERGLLSLQEAIYKMTALPAETFGIHNRGQIKVGKKADISIFNPGEIIDNATFTEPHQYPSGMVYVLVNGKLAVDQSQFMGIRAGELLRKNNL